VCPGWFEMFCLAPIEINCLSDLDEQAGTEINDVVGPVQLLLGLLVDWQVSL